MKHKILAGLSVLLVCWAQAAPQFSQDECITLNQQRLELRKQLRQPYDAAHGKRLQQELRELERLLSRHCKKPVKTLPVQPVSRQNG
jgi:transcription initiation factor IIE alpha subunit